MKRRSPLTNRWERRAAPAASAPVDLELALLTLLRSCGGRVEGRLASASGLAEALGRSRAACQRALHRLTARRLVRVWHVSAFNRVIRLEEPR